MPQDAAPLTRLGFALAAAVAGWLVGYASALAAERLMLSDGDGLPVHARRGLLRRDALVQGGLAASWALLALRTGPDLRWAVSAALAVFLVQISVTDLRYRFVYLYVVGAGTLAGAALSPWLLRAPPWAGLAGGVGGGLAFLLVYGLGRLLYRRRGLQPMARGDIYIAAMVGAMAGPLAVTALFLGTLFGGVLAGVALLVARDRQAFMPYGPGLCLGGLAALLLGVG